MPGATGQGRRGQCYTATLNCGAGARLDRGGGHELVAVVLGQDLLPGVHGPGVADVHAHQPAARQHTLWSVCWLVAIPSKRTPRPSVSSGHMSRQGPRPFGQARVSQAATAAAAEDPLDVHGVKCLSMQLAKWRVRLVWRLPWPQSNAQECLPGEGE